MVYLVPIPGLCILGLVSVQDIRSRQVHRSWILLGILVQLASLLGYCVTSPLGYWPLVIAFSITLVSTLLQSALALIRPGALGLGDITSTALAAFSIGVLGWASTILFWFLTGTLGLLAISLYYWLNRKAKCATDRAEVSFPFVTILFTAAIATDIITYLIQ